MSIASFSMSATSLAICTSHWPSGHSFRNGRSGDYEAAQGWRFRHSLSGGKYDVQPIFCCVGNNHFCESYGQYGLLYEALFKRILTTMGIFYIVNHAHFRGFQYIIIWNEWTFLFSSGIMHNFHCNCYIHAFQKIAIFNDE